MSRHWGLTGFIVLALFAVLPAVTLADGAFVWQAGADLLEPQQRAIIHFADGAETLVLQVKYEGAAEDFAWIVPLPAVPKVSAVEPKANPFAEISLFTQERERTLSGSRQAAASEPVTVLERKTVGIFDTAVLKADDPDALANWLTKNGYRLPDALRTILADYTKKKWAFVAVKIDPKALDSDEAKKLKTGQLQPIKFDFRCDKMIYPLRISSVNAGKTEILLYLLADAPMVRADGPDDKGFAPPVPPVAGTGMPKAYGQAIDPHYTTAAAVSAKELPLTWSALGLDEKATRHLVKYRVEFTGKEMTGDLTFKPFDPLPYWKARLEDTMDARERSYILEVLVSLDKSFDKQLAEVREQLRQEELALTAKLAASKEPYERECVARYANVSPEVLEKLSSDPVVTVRISIAGRTDLTDQILMRLLSDPEASVHVAAAWNTKTPAHTRATIFARDEESLAWWAERTTDPMLLRLLAADKNHNIREYLARNPACPAEVVVTLAYDPDEGVRRTAAGHRNLPAEMLPLLAHDPSHWVRQAVAMQKRTPRDTLMQLAGDEQEAVSKSAKETLALINRPTRSPTTDTAPEAK